MKLTIKALEKKDFNKAIQYAITGMHFNWYLDSKILLDLYGRYFWYMETNRATQIIAAYYGEALAGVLLAEMKGEPKVYNHLGRKGYVAVFDWLQKLFFKGSANVYECTTKRMLDQYKASNNPDGEVIFLAANPDLKIKGIGTTLLAELERREKGKTIFLYTDNACTYQFYEHRGFKRAEEEDIVLELGKKKVPLKCLLYSKCLAELS